MTCHVKLDSDWPGRPTQAARHGPEAAGGPRDRALPPHSVRLGLDSPRERSRGSKARERLRCSLLGACGPRRPQEPCHRPDMPLSQLGPARDKPAGPNSIARRHSPHHALQHPSRIRTQAHARVTAHALIGPSPHGSCPMKALGPRAPGSVSSDQESQQGSARAACHACLASSLDSDGPIAACPLTSVPRPLQSAGPARPDSDGLDPVTSPAATRRRHPCAAARLTCSSPLLASPAEAERWAQPWRC